MILFVNENIPYLIDFTIQGSLTSYLKTKLSRTKIGIYNCLLASYWFLNFQRQDFCIKINIQGKFAILLLKRMTDSQKQFTNRLNEVFQNRSVLRICIVNKMISFFKSSLTIKYHNENVGIKSLTITMLVFGTKYTLSYSKSVVILEQMYIFMFSPFLL